MSNFKDAFIRVLSEDQDVSDLAPVLTPDREAMASTLSPGTSPEQFDVPAPRIAADTEVKQKQLEELKGWVSKINEFVDFLNAANSESMQSKLHAAHSNSLFETIAGSEKKKISRIAAELSSFGQTLKGYLISSNG